MPVQIYGKGAKMAFPLQCFIIFIDVPKSLGPNNWNTIKLQSPNQFDNFTMPYSSTVAVF